MIINRTTRIKRKRIRPEKVQKGMVIEIPLPWFKHPFWRSRFLVKSDNQIEKIKKLDIPFVFILEQDSSKEEEKRQHDEKTREDKIVGVSIEEKESSYSEVETEKKQTPSAKVHHIRYQKCAKAYEETLYEVKAFINGLLFFSEESLKDSEKMMKRMVDTLMKDPNTMLFLINAKQKKEEVFHHALNVCMLSLLLARASDITSEEMLIIGLGALFHDIGKLKIPKSILLKTQPLTKHERSFLQLHPQFGIEIVSRIKTFPEGPKKIIAEHHETLDGKGYPKGLKENEINALTRIVSIVNTYDNLCNPPVAGKAMTPYHALAYMYKKLSSKLDSKLVELFINLLGIYPPGTIVRLSDKSIGIVVSKSPNRPNKPSVLIYDPSVSPSKAPVISLEDEPSLSVEETLHPLSLHQEVFNYLNPPLRIAYMVDSFIGKK
ncbi:MAG: HD-GYP domain-containing protein [Syntrophobacterales bacterium]|nr:HD-GYP domain-containing protein [Syntrophobacterales bacterium]